MRSGAEGEHRDVATKSRKTWKETVTNEKAQLYVSFLLISLVGMNDSATGANVRRSLLSDLKKY